MASNPFVAFRDLPVRSRYRFLLDDALAFVMQFIKGPVCRGPVALDVIENDSGFSSSTRTASCSTRTRSSSRGTSKHLYLPTAEGATRLGLALLVEVLPHAGRLPQSQASLHRRP